MARVHHAFKPRHLLFGVVGLIVLLALAAPLLPLPHPNAIDLDNRLAGLGSAGHPLGTDFLGRDMLARLLDGTRTSLRVAFIATLIACTVGSGLGILAGFFGGRTDASIMRSIDLLMAFPYLIFALALVAVLGSGLQSALIAIAVVNIPFFARTVRGVTVGLRTAQYIEAASVMGQPARHIIIRHVLPNVTPTLIITFTTTFAWMLLETAGLSFLGLGAQPPQADLGTMLADGRKLMLVYPHIALLPGLLIFLIAAALNLFGDALRDRLDPREEG